MTVLLIDTPRSHRQLCPLSLTRPVGDLWLGATTLRGWWQQVLGCSIGVLGEAYLTPPESLSIPPGNCLCIDASVLPVGMDAGQLLSLQPGDLLEDASGLIAFAAAELPAFGQVPLFHKSAFRSAAEAVRLQHPIDLVRWNARALAEQATGWWKPAREEICRRTNTILGDGFLHLGEHSRIEGCTVNLREGPVIIDDGALVMEGSSLRGPLYIGRHAVVKMGARIYGGTSIADHVTAGGEIKNSIIMAGSNKAHDGYLGDSVIGSWCNLGAGTTVSNVKNTGAPVRMWHEDRQDFVEVGQKAGLVMGDYCRTAIQTLFNTGTTIGPCSHIHAWGMPDKHIRPFHWDAEVPYELSKALQHLANWKAMKGDIVGDDEQRIIAHLFRRFVT